MFSRIEVLFCDPPRWLNLPGMLSRAFEQLSLPLSGEADACSLSPSIDQETLHLSPLRRAVFQVSGNQLVKAKKIHKYLFGSQMAVKSDRTRVKFYHPTSEQKLMD